MSRKEPRRGAAWRHPSIIGALMIILGLLGMSIYAVVALPLHEAIHIWNGATKEVRYTPTYAMPAWTNLFRRVDLPETIDVRKPSADFASEAVNETVSRLSAEWSFEYRYVTFPKEVSFFSQATYGEHRPILTLTWVRPDGQEIQFYRGQAQAYQRTRLEHEFGLEELLGRAEGSGSAEREALPGIYRVRAELLTTGEDVSLEGRLILYGRVHGIAGTDGEGRDLSIPLLWGTPIALIFGILATLGTTIISFVVAAIGAWFGGFTDAAIQRMTEVSMMLPMLPILMMIGRFFSSSLWVILGCVVALGILTASVKTYRAAFLQLREAPYIEAARCYGAKGFRIVFRYLMPSLIPVMLPSLVLGIPRFVFLEASLAVLGLSDPQLPTWGKVLSLGRDAIYVGHLHMVAEPAGLLLLTGLSFSMLGYSLDRVFNPRLRSQ